MKKYIIYILIFIVGIFLGYIIFNTPSKENKEEENIEKNQKETTWTCSMHPQIKKQEPGDCPICGMDLTPADEVSANKNQQEFQLTENALALANIETSSVEISANEENTLLLSGTIEENEETTEIQAAYFSGRIEKLLINYEGASVKRGQLIATIYSPELVAAQQELITAAKNPQSQLYQAVKNKLKSWKLSDQQINKIEKSGKVEDNFPIYANVSGTVTEKMVETGNYVEKGQGILKISNLSKVWAVLDAYENQLSFLKEGQKLKVIANSYPHKEFEAEINFIDPQLTSTTRTVNVRATLENDNQLLKPGMFVKARLETENINEENSISIPKTAVMWTGKRSVVYIKTSSDQPTFEMREVKLGAETGDNYIIINGLEEDEEIVTNGTFTIDAAAQLQGKKSMMSQNKNMNDLNISGEFQEKFLPVLENYLQLKDALVASDDKSAATSAEKMKSEIDGIKNNSEEKLQQQLNFLTEHAEKISASNSLEKQREQFISLSDLITELVIALPDLENKLYLQECPMANNNQGARWLSQEKKIRNPYYGDKMLTCGSVLDSIE